MKRVHGTHKPPTFASSSEDEDVISRMPENVITNILDRLLIQDAVRTGILSRNWRFKWNFLTQLVFDQAFFWYLHGKDKTNKYNANIIITRLLVHLKGPITKFYLHINNYILLDVEDVNHLVLLLSRKGIEEFTLMNMSTYAIKLSSHIFSCLDLKHLKLRNCSFHVPPNYCGYPNLLSLNLDRVILESGNCGEIINQCPLLESLEVTDNNDAIGKVKLVEIEKLEKLKILYFPMSLFDNTAITRSDIFQLGRCHPQLQVLTLDFNKCNFLGETGVREWVCTARPCLKTLTLYQIAFGSASMLSFAFEMIWGSPNLQTLEIKAYYRNAFPPPAFSFPEVDNNTKLQLQNVMFSCFRGSENEVYLIKSILACSPLLQNIKIHANSPQVFGDDNGKLNFARKLLAIDRASPKAKVLLF